MERGGSPKAGPPRSPGVLPPQVKLAEEVAASRRRVAQLKADVEAAQADNAKLGDELAAAQAVNLDLQTEVTAAAAERRAAETRLAGVQAVAADVQRQADELQAVRVRAGAAGDGAPPAPRHAGWRSPSLPAAARAASRHTVPHPPRTQRAQRAPRSTATPTRAVSQWQAAREGIRCAA